MGGWGEAGGKLYLAAGFCNISRNERLGNVTLVGIGPLKLVSAQDCKARKPYHVILTN